MNATASAKNSSPYVHKLRLEAREGARVAIDPLIESQPGSQSGWAIAKFVGASLAVTSLLVFLTRELLR
jgi:hypothetical protein